MRAPLLSILSAHLNLSCKIEDAHTQFPCRQLSVNLMYRNNIGGLWGLVLSYLKCFRCAQLSGIGLKPRLGHKTFTGL